MKLTRVVGLVGAVAALLAISFAVPASAVASSLPSVGIGSTTLATPASGGRYIYVSTTGHDTVSEYKTWLNGYDTYNRYHCLLDSKYLTEGTSQTTCPEPSASDPLRNIQTAVRVAHPGDVIVVRAGNYKEEVGWSAVKGTASRPIVMQAYPGEKVYLDGTLILHSPSYWTIQGFRFVYDKAIQGTGQAIVYLSGGQHWIFENNEVRGSPGYANVIIQSDTATSSSVAALTAAAPKDYLVYGNCIHDNVGVNQALDHNIYLTGTIYQTGGVIEHNLLFDAPRGSNIKAAASGTGYTRLSPANVNIEYNTMLDAASGVTVGLDARGLKIEHNLIALPLNSQAVDGGIHVWALANPPSNTVEYNLINGYTYPIHEPIGQTTHFVTAGNVGTSVTFTGSATSCSSRPTSATISSQYGHYAGS
jgi:hypothetical protein